MQDAHTSIVSHRNANSGNWRTGGLSPLLLKGFGELAGLGIVCRIMTKNHVE